MADSIKIDFKAFGAVEGGDLVVFVGDDLKPGPAAAKQIGAKALDLIARAAPIERFKGKAANRHDPRGPGGSAGRPPHRRRHRRREGARQGRLRPARRVRRRAGSRPAATVLVDLPGLDADPGARADLALGTRLRAYSFDRYKTAKKDDDNHEDEPDPHHLRGRRSRRGPARPQGAGTGSPPA